MEKTNFTDDELKVTRYFLKQLKENNVPSDQDLIKYVKKRKINFGNTVSTKKILRKIRNNIESPSIYTTIKPVKSYQTITIDELGLLSADYGEFKPENKNMNKGYVGFFMVVSVCAQKRWAVPMKGKYMSEFENAMEVICMGNIFPAVTTILSDRERAVFSERFQAKMKEKYNITIHFIHRMNKAWSAENAIRFTKEDLSIVTDNNNSKRWIHILPQIMKPKSQIVTCNVSFLLFCLSLFFDRLSVHSFAKTLISSSSSVAPHMCNASSSRSSLR